MKKTLLLSIFFLVLFISTLSISHLIRRAHADSGTIAICQQQAVKEKIEYVHTDFRNVDFYTWCIENIEDTSPLFDK